MICLGYLERGVRDGAFILLCVLWASWNYGLVSDINFEEFFLHYSNISPVPSFLLLKFWLYICFTFSIYLTVLGYFVLFFSLLFSLVFSVFGGCHWAVLKFKDFFVSCVQSTNKQNKGIFRIVFLSLAFFVFIHRISISLLTLPIHSCILSILSIKGFNILIIIVLNSWSDNHNIPAISESSSLACCLFCVFCL